MAHESPHPSRRRRTALLVLAVVVLALALSIPVAWASHQFTDVPDSNPFHTEISAIAGAGITSGKTCVPPGTPPTYCPTENVNRQAMAAFMHRGFGRVGFGQSGAPLTTTPEDLAIVVIDVGGVPGGTQFVQLTGAAGAQIANAADCPCTSRFVLTQDGVGEIAIGQYVTNDQTVGQHLESAALTAAVAVPAGTTQTFRIKGARAIHTDAGSVIAGGSLTAVVVPFGNTGGSTLGVTSTTEALEGTPFDPTP